MRPRTVKWLAKPSVAFAQALAVMGPFPALDKRPWVWPASAPYVLCGSEGLHLWFLDARMSNTSCVPPGTFPPSLLYFYRSCCCFLPFLSSFHPCLPIFCAPQNLKLRQVIALINPICAHHWVGHVQMQMQMQMQIRGVHKRLGVFNVHLIFSEQTTCSRNQHDVLDCFLFLHLCFWCRCSTISFGLSCSRMCGGLAC